MDDRHKLVWLPPAAPGTIVPRLIYDEDFTDEVYCSLDRIALTDYALLHQHSQWQARASLQLSC